jgi:hypothetical protein
MRGKVAIPAGIKNQLLIVSYPRLGRIFFVPLRSFYIPPGVQDFDGMSQYQDNLFKKDIRYHLCSVITGKRLQVSIKNHPFMYSIIWFITTMTDSECNYFLFVLWENLTKQTG